MHSFNEYCTLKINGGGSYVPTDIHYTYNTNTNVHTHVHIRIVQKNHFPLFSNAEFNYEMLDPIEGVACLIDGMCSAQVDAIHFFDLSDRQSCFFEA